MRILIDTHILLWAIGEPGRLSASTRDDLSASQNVVLFSAVSILEVAIKTARQRPTFTLRPERVLQTALTTGFAELPVHAAMILKVADLPHHHGDPFDRLLLAQAIAADCRLYTCDAKLLGYGHPVVRA